ncbi:MAG: Stk1 family PASTA domain-containing Ser/Thr kinase [Actinobacteria bacterium]|nr:Stk1 family PASTA domain-containing Ser/Thr kinase [Actinomycetota bacterium]
MSNADPLLGHVLDGRYEILRKLARGGMATVYLATDRRLTRTVAVKVMHDNLGSDQDFVSRFDREARAAARLSHPNVVSVFDQGMDAGRPYMVMEYVEGSTLRNLISREAPMEPQRALDLMIPVTAAVAAAHEAGIIHRDLKPENVLISTRGQIKVADFGLARAVTAHTATANGMLIGTVSYIAPELVTHGHADTRCDVYALGVLLFEMLTGRKPHTGDTPIQVAYSHVHNEISLPSLSAPAQWRDTRSAVPPYLDAIVTTAAARQPADRPADAKVLLDHLRQAREAIEQGVLDDPLLTARMRETALDASSQVTEMVPAVLPHGEVQRTATLRFTPSTPISPNHPGAADGMPYYDAPPASVPSPSAVPLQQRRAQRRRRGAFSLVLVLLLTAVLGVGAWYLLAGRFTATPDFDNLTQAQATSLAAKNGLQLAWDEEFSETVPVGQVTRTDPEAGDRVLRGGTVTAFLSKGPERYPVPSLVNRTPEDATRALEDAHLKAGKQIEVFHESIAAGTVVSGSIDAGKMVRPGTVVNLNVSKGPPPVEVVSFKNKPFAEAEAYYTNAGLVVQKADDAYSSTVAVGNVISSDPKVGRSVPRGGTITFTVSKGPEMITVPQVRGLTQKAATKKLKDLGFKVDVQRTLPFGSTALGTNPGEGQQAAKGSTVTLYVG